MSSKKKADIRIIILQRGWVMVGEYARKGNYVTLSKASVIRRWGTTKGLGELAANGPLPNTVLDPANGVVEAHELVVLTTIACEPTKWVL